MIIFTLQYIYYFVISIIANSIAMYSNVFPKELQKMIILYTTPVCCSCCVDLGFPPNYNHIVHRVIIARKMGLYIVTNHVVWRISKEQLQLMG